MFTTLKAKCFYVCYVKLCDKKYDINLFHLLK